MLYNKYDKEVLRKKLMEETFPRTTLSFYRYVIIENVSEMRDSLYKELDALNVFGRIYVAREGINAQISVPTFNFEKFVNGRTYQWFNILDLNDAENKFISIPGLASPKDFHLLVSDKIFDLNCLPAGCQCLPLYRYDDKAKRHDNITDWGLEQFQNHYKNKKITKEDIFLLHLCGAAQSGLPQKV